MDIKVICKKCEKEITVCQSDITFERACEDEKEQSIFITYFDCPECQERHYVQIDNGQTLSLKRGNIKMFRKLSRLRDRNKPISKQQSERFAKLRDVLNSRRNELMKQYDGSLVTDTETGEQIKLSFTVL